uniref:Heat shock factor protein 1 n=3 Tax=Lygus hesperus TaxID=30085 RepID=A0A0A9Z1H6_LYGHE
MIPKMSSNNASVATTVPAFIAKLWHMVSDPNCDDLICWAEDGTSFFIKDQVRFCSQLLPRYYKHNNMASFIRQLNKYGFHKVSSIESSSLLSEKGDYEFAHEFFVKDCVKSLEMIKRKMSSTSREIVDIKGDMTPLLQNLLMQVQELKDNHENVEAKITSMKRENDALWREHSVLRQKYVKQQKMINQLIQFLVTLVQQTRGVNVNRPRGGPIILKDLQQTPLMAIEAKKRNTPVISEIDSLETTDPKGNSSTTYTLSADDPLISPSPSYLIDSPIAVDQTDPSVMLFTAPESPGEPPTLQVSSSPTFTEPTVVWHDGPTVTGIQSLNSPISSFSVGSPSSSQVNLTVCPQDVTPAIIPSKIIASSQKNESGKERNNVNMKKPSKPKMKVPIVVKQEKLDSNDSSDIMFNIDETTEPDSTEDERSSTKRKEPEASSSLVLSDKGSRQELENHLDVVQSDLDSLKDILQGLDTSAFMSLFNEQDPLGLNMPDSSNKQQLVSIYPGLIDISDMLMDDEGDPLPSSPVDTTAIDSLLNTPQPTPSLFTEPNFNPPKRLKK